MRNRKLERALYGPTVYEITFGVVLSVALGAALAIAFLIFKPAVVVQEMPKEDERIQGTTYYVEGTADAVKGKQWMRKRQLLLEGAPGEIALTEDDLNLWFLNSTDAGQKELDKRAKAAVAAEIAAAKAKAAAKPPAKPAKPGSKPAPAPAEPAPVEEPAPEAPPKELLSYGVMNFRIRNSEAQVGLPCAVNTFGYLFPVTVQARGGFEKRDDMYVFLPDHLMVGSLPLHRFPHAIEYVVNKALTHEGLPPELLTAWKKVKSVVVEDNAIKMAL